MKVLVGVLVGVLIGMCGTARADFVATNGPNTIRLLENAPCTNEEILTRLKPEFHAQFQRAIVNIGARTMPGCWIDTMEGAYYLQFPDGGMAFPVTIFVSEPGV